MTLRCDHITFAYPHGSPVLREVSLELQPGRVLGLLGLNGGGKSTLLQCFNGTLRPQSGEVYLNGHCVGDARAVVRSRGKLPSSHRTRPLMFRFPFARWRCWAATPTRAVGGRRWPKTPKWSAVALRGWAWATLRIARSANSAAASGNEW